VARALFSEHGVAVIKLGGIAREADLPTATLYRYFPTKEILLAQLMNEVLGKLLDDARRKLDRVKNMREFVATFRGILWDSYETIQDHPFLHEAFSTLFSERSEKNILHDEHQKWVELFFITARRFIDDSDQNLRLRVQVLNEMWNGTMRLASFSGKRAGDVLMKEAIAIYSRELGLPSNS